MPYCIKILIRSIGLRSIKIAKSRTVIKSPTTTSVGSLWAFAAGALACTTGA